MGPRVSLSVLLILSGFVLLGAIAAGNRMGAHVLGQVSERTEAVPTPLLTPVAEVKDRQVSLGWKHAQLVSVATDPAFPDPRVTPVPPEPVPAYHARKRARRATPEPGFTDPPLPPLPPLDKQGEPLPDPGTPIPYETPQE